MIKPRTAPGEIFHIYNRGVEKRDIFMSDDDYLRFIRCLYELNDAAPVEKLYLPSKIPDVRHPESRRKRDLLVDILSFCLMPNHYHLLVREHVENGIRDFTRKLGTGYTNFFNQKYNRQSMLFQGTHKRAHVTENSHFTFLPHYIHLNPLDITIPAWRNGTLQDSREAFQYLESYRWSSYLDYMGIENFPSVTRRDILRTFLGSPSEQKRDILEWIQRNGPETLDHIALE